MKVEQIPPTLEMHNLRILALSVNEDLLVYKALEEGKKAGLKPSMDTYNQTLLALGKIGSFDNVLHVLAEIKSRGLKPDIRIYENYLLPGLLKASRTKEVLNILHDMIAVSVQPTMQTFHGALEGPFWAENQTEKLLDLVSLMVTARIIPNLQTAKLILENPTFKKAVEKKELPSRCKLLIEDLQTKIKKGEKTDLLKKL